MSTRSESSAPDDHCTVGDYVTSCDYALLKARGIAELAMGWKGEEFCLTPESGSDRPTLHYSMWALTELLDEARERLDQIAAAYTQRRKEGQP